jgi:hypothetical protein
MNSITASTVSPISTLNLGDSQYTTTLSWPASATTTQSAALYFPNLNYPVVGEFILQLSTTAITPTTNSLVYSASLQDSVDGVTFAQMAVFSSTLFSTTDASGTAPVTTVQVLLPPPAANPRPYIRATLGTPASIGGQSGPTGSFTLKALF